MSAQEAIRILAAGLVLGTAMFFSSTASAVTLRTYVATIYQIGTGSQVQIGHTVVASTNFNRLFAGGTYTAACAASEMLPTTGQRFLSSEALNGPRLLNVTIPTNQPARVNMPGFDSAALRGRRLDCTYNWTSRAVESQFSIGAGGVGYTIGGGEMSEGSSVLFSMSVPSLSDVNDGSTCIP